MSAAPMISTGKKIQLVVTAGPNAGMTIESDRQVIQIGRTPENDLALMKDAKVSRNHLELVQHPSGIVVRNVSSTSPAMANNHPISEPTLLGQGGNLRLGDSEINVSLIVSVPTVRVSSPPISPSPSQHYPPPPSSPQFTPPVAAGGGSKILFYIVIAALVLGGGYFFNQQATKKMRPQLRSSSDLARELEDTQSKVEELKKEASARGTDTKQYRWAEEYYMRGFRDYVQGQYGRAVQSLRAAVQVYPEHTLARKYLPLAERRYDEMLNFHLAQGRRYYGKGNYRLCASSYRSALEMIYDTKGDKYAEAKAKFDECTLRESGGG